MASSDTRALSGEQLLAGYRAGATSFFASPSRTILATGNRLAPSTTYAMGRLDIEIRDLLDQYDIPLVLAAVPYDPAGAGCVVVPEALEVTGPLDDGLGDEAPADGALAHYVLTNRPERRAINGHDSRRATTGSTAHPSRTPYAERWASTGITARPSRADYADSVADAVERIRAGELGKVVLARSLDLTGGQVDATAILAGLARRDPHGYTYALDLPPTASGTQRRLVGASPELLVARTGRRVVARPVAGSAARSPDPDEDVRRGAALLASAKDLAEHAFVVDAVVASLTPYCRDLRAPTRPTLVGTATMWHLLTEVSGELVDPSTTSLALALALHPTPAVCGTPTAAAHVAIGELETFDRDFYAGVVGWCDAAGDGEWAVALRCAELRTDTIRLYSGAGIVAGSDPASEVEETSAKFRTMLDAMGLDHDA